MEPIIVPFNYCYRWIICSMRVGERFYNLFLVCGLCMALSLFILSFIPRLGGTAILLLLFLYSIAAMRLTQKIFKDGSATFDDFLRFTFDKMYLDPARPFIWLLAILAAIQLTTSFLHVTVILLFGSILSTVLLFLFCLAGFMLVENPSLSLQNAIEKTLIGFWQNILTALVAALLVCAFGTISAMLCLVPFFLYFLPMIFAAGYLIYASIYEDLNIDSVITEWSGKSPVRTSVGEGSRPS